MTRLIKPSFDGERIELSSPTAMPQASAFLWNRRLLLQLNCRGYAVAQHMQPEPAKYSHGPALEQRTFMQPEQPYYAHHPGRYVYVKDETLGTLSSIPHEPVRRTAERFLFSAGKADVAWQVSHPGYSSTMSVRVPADDVVELWRFEIRNTGDCARRLSVYPYFTIGYMSWMNQSARYESELGGILARSVTPYQKLEDYPRIAGLKDCTFLLHGTVPDAWEASRDSFEGEGGLHDPDAVKYDTLGNGDAVYETPVGVLQYRITLQAGESRRFEFLFGPAAGVTDAAALRDKYLTAGGFENAREHYAAFLAKGKGCLHISTPDAELDNFVNHWLDRQIYYHGDSKRLTTDPQTRNFLQDGMGMVFVQPAVARDVLCTALSQQRADGSMPDGIVLTAEAQLKYINEIPHTDHCVWLPICLQAYLDETGDLGILDEAVTGTGDKRRMSVFDRVTDAMQWLTRNRDARGLSLIAQGDWCDPMNMVGHGGKGVSGWLTIATVYALTLWAGICKRADRGGLAAELAATAERFADAAQQHLWDGDWFARGISDNGKSIGVRSNREGRIFLNPQSWALLAGIATDEQRRKILAAVRDELATPYGAMLLAPAYTHMHEDVGRVSQKHPGHAENGSIYNHAAAFYVCALYAAGDADQAFEQLRRMLPGPAEDDYVRRGQLPVFVANYYRGAARQYPRTAGRSSQLFNTGAASWLYRTLVEETFGLRGTDDGLSIEPKLPSEWQHAAATRRFRGAEFAVTYRRDRNATRTRVLMAGAAVDGNLIRDFEADRHYTVEVILPDTAV